MEWLTQLLRSVTGMFRWWIIIAPWEQGVRIRLGREATLLLPGSHFRVPLLDRVHVVAIRLRMVQGRSQTATTKDGAVVTVGCAIQYGVKDAVQLFKTIANPESTMMARVRSVVSEVVSKVDREDLTRDLIQAAAEEAIDGEKWGLDSVTVGVVDMAFVRTFRLMQAVENEEFRDLDYAIRNSDRPDVKR